MGEDLKSETHIPTFPDWKADLAVHVARFMAQLKQHFAPEISSDLVRFRQQLVYSIRRALPARRLGRQSDPHLDQAVKMIHDGKTFREALRFLVPNLEKLDRYDAMLARQRLNAAIRRRRGRHAAEKRLSVPDANPLVSPSDSQS